MVEGGDEPNCVRQQHAVAEDVTRHVAHAGDAERLRLDVDVHLAEVTLHALPRATGCYAHALVVVADGAAGGERIAEPEVVRGGDLIGDVRERRRALVGGYDEVRIIAVVSHDLHGRYNLAILRLSVRSSRVEIRCDRRLMPSSEPLLGA